MCDECGWEDLATKIEEMTDCGDFNWAEDTLEGILEWVNENEHCTEGQTNAVNNIADSRS